MNRMLKVALEGEQVEIVEGMFIGVPIGMGEDVQAISTEAFGETLKKAGQKVWEVIAKIAAAIAAAIKGFINHITGRTSKDRTMTEEVRRQYELLAKKFTERRPLTVEDKVNSVIKADGLGEKFWDKLSVEKKTVLTNPGYKDAIVKITALLSNNGHRQAIVDVVNSFVNVINTPGNQEAQLAEAEKMRKVFAECVEPMNAAMSVAKEAMDKVDSDKPSFPENIHEQIGTINGVTGWLKTLNIFTISGNWKLTLEKCDHIVGEISKRASALANKGVEGADGQLTEVLRRYWEMIKLYMSAVNYMTRFEADTWGLVGEIIAFRKEALSRTKSAHKGEKDVVEEINAELDGFFDHDMQNLFKEFRFKDFDFKFDFETA
jgi:hypothetical protein